MGQPAIDLPDPLEPSAGGAAAAVANPDDLLAQLAGEEVDRLLADAEDGRAAPSALNADHPPAAGGPGPAVEERLEAVERLVGQTASAVDATEAALDDLFKELNEATIPGARGGDGGIAGLVEAELGMPARRSTDARTPGEAGEGRPDASSSPAATAGGVPAPAEPAADTTAALDDLFAQLNAAEIPAPAAKAPEPPAEPAGVDASLDDLFAQLNAADIPVPASKPGASAPAVGAVAPPAPAAAATAAEPPSVADALAAEMAEDDRIHGRVTEVPADAAVAELAATADEPVTPAPDDEHSTESAGATAAATVIADEASEPADEAAAAAAEPSADETQVEAVIEESAAEPLEGEAEMAEEVRVPLLVRMLEWLNAPLAGLSDGVREALGKIAIVTTLNAVAVLVYVIAFRKHP